MQPVGFEPTSVATIDLESTALDRSATTASIVVWLTRSKVYQYEPELNRYMYSREEILYIEKSLRAD